MEVKQIYGLVNDATSEILGESAIINEDLSNSVDIGEAVFNANAFDRYVKALVNHIGRVIFVNRPYRGGAPSVLMDGWEFGSVLEKIAAEMPVATENESWELEDGASYDPNVFTSPRVSAKFFNKKTTFEIPMSITERQVKQSFSNAMQLNGFISMIYNEIEKSLTVKTDALIMRTINNIIAETIYDEYGATSLSSKSGVRAVNLLYLYNQRFTESLTAGAAITDPDFIRFAAFEMGVYAARLSKISTLFNVGGKHRFTPSDMLHVVTLADFRKAANVYLQSNVFHDEFTVLPNSEEVPFWQGSGTGYALDDISSINVDTASGHTVSTSGILGVMFDRDALGVANFDKRVTTNYNGRAEFTNVWYKQDAQYFNDLNENAVVFFVA